MVLLWVLEWLVCHLAMKVCKLGLVNIRIFVFLTIFVVRSQMIDVYDDLRDVLYNDSAIAGEAAGYAMGLLMLGTGSSKALDEMLQYAHETQHEKIIRGLAVGISLLFYAKEEAADAIIETLTSDKVR